MRNSHLQNDHILWTKMFVPELEGPSRDGMILGYDKVQRFIVIPSVEWQLPVLGCGHGYDKF